MPDTSDYPVSRSDGRMVARWLLAILIVAAIISIRFAVRGDQPPRPLHVVVTGLPQCEYGIGWEQPVVGQLERGGRVLAEAQHAGVYTGGRSLDLSFYVASVSPGPASLRFGKCPPLTGDLQAAAACSAPNWFDRIFFVANPRGIDEPQEIRVEGWEFRCLSRREVPPDGP